MEQATSEVATNNIKRHGPEKSLKDTMYIIIYIHIYIYIHNMYIYNIYIYVYIYIETNLIHHLTV